MTIHDPLHMAVEAIYSTPQLCGFSEVSTGQVRRSGFVKPSPIQMYSWPLAVQGKVPLLKLRPRSVAEIRSSVLKLGGFIVDI